MNTFNLIAHKIFIYDTGYTSDINIENAELFTCGNYMKHIFKEDTDNLHLNFTKCRFLFLDSNTKFATLKDNYMDSFFVTLENKESFLDFFCRIQRTYRVLNNFAYLIKKRNKKVIVSNDLYLTPINKSQNNVFNYYENNYIYLFTLQDLSRIITSAICNSPLFYSESLPPKNPYSGVEFPISDLYNIYFHMKNTFTHVPLVIQQYYLSGFNVDKFEIQNQVTIRNIYIDQFVESEDHDTIIEYIEEMTEPYNISFHPHFPKNTLIATFKGHLVEYLHSRYSLDSSKKHISASSIKRKLSTFARCNPTFGRRIIVFKEKKKYCCFITLDGKSELIRYHKDEMSDDDNDDYSMPTIHDEDEYYITPNISDDEHDNTLVENTEFVYNIDFQSSINSTTLLPQTMYHAFIESRTMNLLNDEMVFAEEDYFDSDDEIEVDESLYDP